VHTPGLKVVVPSTPYDAKGLLIASVQDPDPVIFFEPKKLYFAPREEVPEGVYTVPLGVSRLVREGKDVSVITYGSLVYVASEVAEKMDQEGISIEILDLRTLLPFDGQALLATARKTGRVIALVEAPKFCSFASEISAFLAENTIESLQAPIRRVTGYFTPYPYWTDAYYIPTSKRLEKAIREILAY